MILKARSVTIRDTASTPDISEGSVRSIVYDILGFFYKVCAWCVVDHWRKSAEKRGDCVEK
jgi:hypothetical protein